MYKDELDKFQMKEDDISEEAGKFNFQDDNSHLMSVSIQKTS